MIWEAFKTTAPASSPVAGQPVLDFRSTLLYLSADRDLFTGIKKAFSVATHNIAANVRATAQQVERAFFAVPYLVCCLSVDTQAERRQSTEQLFYSHAHTYTHSHEWVVREEAGYSTHASQLSSANVNAE